ncbi:hypothetical protein FACS1894111_10830 [Clostridia bacterium]|nr:hypothetical protein FACS1894111_10830 [Clostridia bacterium]
MLEEKNDLDLQTEYAALLEEVGQLRRENKKLDREMRNQKRFLDKVTLTIEAKDALGKALTVENAKQKSYTKMLLKNCPSIIILLDTQGRVVMSTAALLNAMDVPNFDYIKGKHYEEVLSQYLEPESMGVLRENFEDKLSVNTVKDFDVQADFGLTGEVRFFGGQLLRLEERGVNSGNLLLMTDVTDLLREKQKAESANQAKSQFLATMSHEIRTPMNAIMGIGEILSRSKLDDYQKKYIDDIRNSSASLLTIINDLLDFSKIESRKMEMVNDDYDLHTMLDHLKSMFSVLCKDKGLKLYWEQRQDLPRWIYGDDSRVRQVLTNILSNAVKYTPGGGIRFMASLEGEELCFCIQDSGIGIREEDREKLFKPFEQLDLRKNRGVVGTGLGLAICDKLCILMGGRLSLSSIYGEGSTFFIHIPYVEGKSSEEKDQEELLEFQAPYAEVLVVDDIEVNLMVAEAMLTIFGISPDLASGGLEAVKMAQQKNYDVIFMDQMMPGMDGLEATALIRESNAYNKTVPVVALSANAVSGAAEMFADAQMNDFLAKPIEIEALNRCLRKWLPQGMIQNPPLRTSTSDID